MSKKLLCLLLAVLMLMTLMVGCGDEYEISYVDEIIENSNADDEPLETNEQGESVETDEKGETKKTTGKMCRQNPVRRPE